MGKPQEKKTQKGDRGLRENYTEKNRDKSAASLKGALTYRKKNPTLKWDSMQEGQKKNFKLLLLRRKN